MGIAFLKNSYCSDFFLTFGASFKLVLWPNLTSVLDFIMFGGEILSLSSVCT
jgi:hypothetical protein